MTTPILPALPGLTFPVGRTEEWSTTVQTARSGKETRIGNWTYPIHHWVLAYEFLRSGTAYQEWQQMVGFFNAAAGQQGTWLLQDPDDNSVANQQIGIGDGVTAAFQLVRAFGGFVEPMWAPNVVSAVTVNGVAASFSVAAYGSTTPGLVTLASAPAVGAAIVASFSYYFPCRFEDDKLDLKKFMTALYSADKLAIRSVK